MMILVKVIVIAAVVSGIFGAGYKLADYQAEVEWLEAVNEANQKAVEAQQRFRVLEMRFLNQEKEVITKIEVQEKEIIKYVEATNNHECFDAAGIKLFNQITTSSVPDPSSLP